ncbi:putative uncharacterized protein [Mycolicibacterium canariasense]|uniref:Uncharacterized protein n=1 Tax=Mycolicibacterium canariasense TaxID=228230 RepID=A0A117I982_MYCCR|nr:hypothetical protein [Mycolicibacterium canariasense]MCV7208784.1 hypothetical protein [Mycolicibacterium canariasense]ORV07149.1 hypothetical protein AWB94_14200 [Mycolicibacterium canariasense]GAS94429.1 putative uncharacterized protein [Mycolicibacterium canariasense]
MTSADHTDVATPRDIIRAAVGSNIVDGSWETSESDLEDAADGVLTELDRAGYAVVNRVWVAQLELVDGAGGWVSVHTTPDGAAGALVAWAQGVGIDIDNYDPAAGSRILDDHPDVESYGVSHVEVQR